jgi:hypothetical protein
MSGAPNRTAQVPGASVEKLVSALETIAGIMVMMGLHIPHEEIQEEWLVWLGRRVEELGDGFSIAKGREVMSGRHVARRGLIACSALLLVAGAAGASKAEELDGELIALPRIRGRGSYFRRVGCRAGFHAVRPSAREGNR